MSNVYLYGIEGCKMWQSTGDVRVPKLGEYYLLFPIDIGYHSRVVVRNSEPLQTGVRVIMEEVFDPET